MAYLNFKTTSTSSYWIEESPIHPMTLVTPFQAAISPPFPLRHSNPAFFLLQHQRCITTRTTPRTIRCPCHLPLSPAFTVVASIRYLCSSPTSPLSRLPKPLAIPLTLRSYDRNRGLALKTGDWPSGGNVTAALRASKMLKWWTEQQ